MSFFFGDGDLLAFLSGDFEREDECCLRSLREVEAEELDVERLFLDLPLLRFCLMWDDDVLRRETEESDEIDLLLLSLFGLSSVLGVD